MEINHAIRYLRKKKGWTQQQLADFSNTSKSNISNLENGNQGYSPAILQYLAKAFDCSVSQIFLLAENLDETGRLKEGEAIPIELLFAQLSPKLQSQFRELIVNIVAENNNKK